MELLDGFRDWLKSQYACPVIVEPQELDIPAPRWRLVSVGFQLQGENRRVLNVMGYIQADGNGPGVFLDKMLEMGEKTAELELTEKAFEFSYTLPGGTYKAKAMFSLYGEGSWRENDDEEKWRFTYMEQYRISLSYNFNNT